MVLLGLVNWNFENEKDKKTVKRHEKKNEKKAFYELNKEVTKFPFFTGQYAVYLNKTIQRIKTHKK